MYDISLPVGLGAAVWPGDEAFRLRWTMERRLGATVNVAALRLSVHTGTHTDAPLHTGDGVDGDDAAHLPLDRFIGPCVVVDARGHVTDDGVAEDALDGVDIDGARVLLRTRDHATPYRFPAVFTPPTVALAERLADGGGQLLGVDTPSVDAFASQDLPVHGVLRHHGVAILENLVLHHVPPGRYELLALPLKLVGADGSPVRAVLREP